MRNIKIYKREFFDVENRCGGFVLTFDELPEQTVVIGGREIKLYKSRLRAEFIASGIDYELVCLDENVTRYTAEYQFSEEVKSFPESYILFEGDPRHYTADDLFCGRAIRYGQISDITCSD